MGRRRRSDDDLPPQPSGVDVPAESCVNTEQRVRFIVREMETLRWSRKSDYRSKLHAAWSIGEVRLKQLSAEAHRRVSLDPEDREQYRYRLLSKLEALIEDAMTSRSRVTGQLDVRGAGELLEKAAKIIGIRLDDAPALAAERPRILINLSAPAAVAAEVNADDGPSQPLHRKEDA